MSLEVFTFLFLHALCNAKAETTVMMLSEAKMCTENFDRLKITLHPNYTVDQFSALDPSQRAKLSVEAYEYYTAWIKENSEVYEKFTSSAKLMISAGM